MFIAFISWWYGAGWRQQVAKVQLRLAKIADTFSIDLLAKTLFMPFRQISAGRVDGSLSVKLHALGDKLISRLIGAMVRSVMIIAAIVIMLFVSFVGVARLLLWPLVPVAPLFGLLFMSFGGVPWNQ